MKLLTQRNKVASDKLSILVLFKTFLYQNTEKHFTHINEKYFFSALRERTLFFTCACQVQAASVALKLLANDHRVKIATTNTA